MKNLFKFLYHTKILLPIALFLLIPSQTSNTKSSKIMPSMGPDAKEIAESYITDIDQDDIQDPEILLEDDMPIEELTNFSNLNMPLYVGYACMSDILDVPVCPILEIADLQKSFSLEVERISSSLQTRFAKNQEEIAGLGKDQEFMSAEAHQKKHNRLLDEQRAIFRESQEMERRIAMSSAQMAKQFGDIVGKACQSICLDKTNPFLLIVQTTYHCDSSCDATQLVINAANNDYKKRKQAAEAAAAASKPKVAEKSASIKKGE